jgi:hypothetical protein
MFKRIALAAAAAAAAGLGVMHAAPSAALGSQNAIVAQPSERARRRQMLADLDALPPRYRNRWKAQRRRTRPNMNHVSKRTRRRHRRARAK